MLINSVPQTAATTFSSVFILLLCSDPSNHIHTDPVLNNKILLQYSKYVTKSRENFFVVVIILKVFLYFLIFSLYIFDNSVCWEGGGEFGKACVGLPSCMPKRVPGGINNQRALLARIRHGSRVTIQLGLPHENRISLLSRKFSTNISILICQKCFQKRISPFAEKFHFSKFSRKYPRSNYSYSLLKKSVDEKGSFVHA